MCQACFDQDAMIRQMLLAHPTEREKLTPEGALYYGFKRDPLKGTWVDAWTDKKPEFRAEPVEQ
jgi:hypothetical protein